MGRLRLGEVLVREVPVHEAVEEGRDVGWALVLEIQIVGMLPNIHGEERRAVFICERCIGVRRFANFNLAALSDEPRPAGAELGRAGFGEFVFKTVIAAEGGVDGVTHSAGRGAAAIGRHGMPIEGVVPNLGGVVEQTLILARRFMDDLFQGGVGEGAAIDQFVGVINISLVMFAVMEIQGLF